SWSSSIGVRRGVCVHRSGVTDGLGGLGRVNTVAGPVHDAGGGKCPMLEARGKRRDVGPLTIEAQSLARGLERVTRPAWVALFARAGVAHGAPQRGAQCGEPELERGLFSGATV